MKILHVISTYFPVLGGTEILAQKISENLVSQGHHVRVITSNVSEVAAYYKFGIKPIELPEKQNINGVEVHRLLYCNFLYKLASWQLIQNISWLKLKIFILGRIIKLIRQEFEKNIAQEIEIFKPDVVMTMPHLVINVQSVISIRQKSSFPLVMVPLLHEQDANWPFESMKSALSQVDAVIGVTNHECERLKDFYEVPDQKLFYAPLGVDMIPITNKKPRKNQILFLGRKIFKKGIPLLLDAMNLVWEKIPDVDLVLAGTRNEQTQEIDNIITKINSDRKNKIISVDDISEIKKSQLLSESICLVFPSEIESFGLVILESWVHFTPVITLDLPVFRSIVNHKIDGLLTNPRDPISLAEAIIFMLENPEIAHNMGEIGRSKVEKVFNWQKVTEGYLKSYEYAIAEYNK